MFLPHYTQLSGTLSHCFCGVFAIISVLSVVSACSGDDTVTITGATGQEGSEAASAGTAGQGGAIANSGTAGSSNDAEPVYVIHTTIDTPDGRTAYYVTTSSLTDNSFVDATKGIEQVGGTWPIFAPPEGGYFVMKGSGSILTRYDVTADGELEKGDTVSFANTGANLRYVMWVDSSRAYGIDWNNLQIVGFNPSTMELIDTPPLPIDFSCEESETETGYVIKRSDGFYFPKSCWDDEITSSGSALAHFDPVAETVTVTRDSRCMGMEFGFLADNGDAYWFSNTEASVYSAFQERDIPHDCALRVLAGETAFDENWELDLTTRSGGAPLIAALPAGGSKVWVKVFEKEAMTQAIPLDEIDWGLEVWRWGLMDMESNEEVQLDTQSDLAVYFGRVITVDGERFSPISNADYTETTLLYVTPAGIKRGVVVQGEMRNAVKLR